MCFSVVYSLYNKGIIYSYQGKLIVETLDGLELNEILGDEHASAVHRLIVASVVIALISALLVGINNFKYQN
jgi:hypothetical protein